MLRLLAVFTILLADASLPLLGQDARGSIGGRVTDTQDAVIVGARIAATNQGTGVTATAVTNESARSLSSNPSKDQVIDVVLEAFGLSVEDALHRKKVASLAAAG